MSKNDNRKSYLKIISSSEMALTEKKDREHIAISFSMDYTMKWNSELKNKFTILLLHEF